MKLIVMRDRDGKIEFWDELVGFNPKHYECLGSIDLPIEKPKRTVVKEAEWAGWGGMVEWENVPKDIGIAGFKMPSNAKNIKCTFEVEE